MTLVVTPQPDLQLTVVDDNTVVNLNVAQPDSIQLSVQDVTQPIALALTDPATNITLETPGDVALSLTEFAPVAVTVDAPDTIGLTVQPTSDVVISVEPTPVVNLILEMGGTSGTPENIDGGTFN